MSIEQRDGERLTRWVWKVGCEEETQGDQA